VSGLGFQPRCRKVSLDKLIITPSGVFEPLCQSCIHKDCGNPIEPFDVSVYGIRKRFRLYNSIGTPMAVIECEGYFKNEEEKNKLAMPG
jgi:hypothetical protein